LLFRDKWYIQLICTLDEIKSLSKQLAGEFGVCIFMVGTHMTGQSPEHYEIYDNSCHIITLTSSTLFQITEGPLLHRPAAAHVHWEERDKSNVVTFQARLFYVIFVRRV